MPPACAAAPRTVRRHRRDECVRSANIGSRVGRATRTALVPAKTPRSSPLYLDTSSSRQRPAAAAKPVIAVAVEATAPPRRNDRPGYTASTSPRRRPRARGVSVHRWGRNTTSSYTGASGRLNRGQTLFQRSSRARREPGGLAANASSTRARGGADPLLTGPRSSGSRTSAHEVVSFSVATARKPATSARAGSRLVCSTDWETAAEIPP